MRAWGAGGAAPVVLPRALTVGSPTEKKAGAASGSPGRRAAGTSGAWGGVRRQRVSPVRAPGGGLASVRASGLLGAAAQPRRWPGWQDSYGMGRAAEQWDQPGPPGVGAPSGASGGRPRAPPGTRFPDGVGLGDPNRPRGSRWRRLSLGRLGGGAGGLELRVCVAREVGSGPTADPCLSRRSRSPPSATGTRCPRRGSGRPSPPASPCSPSLSSRSQR